MSEALHGYVLSGAMEYVRHGWASAVPGPHVLVQRLYMRSFNART